MGLFSGSKKIYVSSTVYNMAGDPNERPNYLKSLVMGSMIGTQNFSIAETLRSGYQTGPGMRMRGFYNWAIRNYDLIGVPGNSIFSASEVDLDIVKTQMVEAFGLPADLAINWVETTVADIVYWARQVLGEDHPELAGLEWAADYDAPSNTGIITFEGAEHDPIIFEPENYDPRRGYIYVSYSVPRSNGTFEEPKMFIYQVGGPNVILNAQYLIQSIEGRYIPFIPIRSDNKFLSESYRPEHYALAKKAYRKLTGGKLDDLIDQIADNESIGDIDFCFLVNGISLNTPSNTGKEYIYRFFKRLIDYQTVNDANYQAWLNLYQGDGSGGGSGGSGGYLGDRDSFDDWERQQEPTDEGAGALRMAAFTMNSTTPDPTGDGSGGGEETPPPSPPPARPSLPYLPRNSILVGTPMSSAFYSEFKMEITWQSTAEEFFTGVGKPGAKKGDLWFTVNGSTDIDLKGYGKGYLDLFTVDEVSLYWQQTANSYSRLNLRGMVHKNTVYAGKSVEITMKEALADEEESGFLIPIHVGTMNDMSTVKQTQLAMISSNLVFNSYQVVKKKWYQTGIFKIILVIAVIVVIAVTGGFGAAGVGVLGTNAAVGASLGFAGVAATIAGVVANMIAAMVITKLITAASVALLGERIGQIVGVILSMATMNVMGGAEAGMQEAFKQMLDPVYLMNMSVAVMSGVAKGTMAEAQEYMRKANDVMKTYKEESKELLAKSLELFGSSDFFFDPLQLTDVDQYLGESVDSFLQRTMMTGMDVAEMTLSAINLYPDVTIQSPINLG